MIGEHFGLRIPKTTSLLLSMPPDVLTLLCLFLMPAQSTIGEAMCVRSYHDRYHNCLQDIGNYRFHYIYCLFLLFSLLDTVYSGF
jgi:hypothetical protein